MRFDELVDDLAAHCHGEQLAHLLSDEELAEQITDDQLAEWLTVDAAQELIRDSHGRHASRWLAEAADIAPRTARRWLGPTPPRARHDTITALALTTLPQHRRPTLAADLTPTDVRTAIADLLIPHDLRAADVLRGATGRVDVGKIEVLYDGLPEGYRNIGVVHIDFSQVITALTNHDLATAAGALSDAILDAYGPDLSEVLDIDDFGNIDIELR